MKVINNSYLSPLKALPRYVEANRFLKKSQWFSSLEITNLQIKRLRKLIKYSYENVPYYHHILRKRNLKPADIKTIEDLKKIPILGKNEINAYMKELISKSFPRKKLLPYSTGGSTGEPTKFMHDWDSLPWIEAANNRFFSWAGKKLFSKIISISPPRAGIIKTARRFKREKSLTIFGGNEERIEEVIKIIKKEKAAGIKGYASSLGYLADFILKSETKDIKLKFVISSSEVLTKETRKTIEEAFNCRVFDNYGSREFAIGGECQEHRGFHIAAENLVVEFVDLNKNESVTDGEAGEIIITDLTRYGMPLIRYRIGDIGVFSSEERCHCGRGLPLIKKLKGRVTEMIVTSQGRHLPGVAIVTMIFKDLNIRQFKVIQEKVDSLKILIVKGKGFSKKDLDFIIESFKELDENLSIKFEFLNEIPTSHTGKHLLVQSLIKR